jgi:predicted glycoside hydrolase/deacetylase ChbG (UPF0249 family)
MNPTHQRTTNQRLGYPDDARLLLINADDLGMYADINPAVVHAFQEGIVRSTSVMMPCPAASQAIALLKETPALHVGVHLSIIRDIDNYFWGPLAPKERVPSLLDADGELYRLEQMDALLARARLDELEVEFRAQIEAVLVSGLQPTHVDWHCLHSGGRADIFDLTMGLAKEFDLALRVASQPFIVQVQRQGLPTDDFDLLDSFSLPLEDKAAHYAAMLRALPVGLTEWAVHPSVGSLASQALDPGGWQVRRTDFDFLISAPAREIIQEEGITLISYELLQTAWRAGWS